MFIILWQAPRAGSMQRILCSDWLPGKMERYCPRGTARFVPANKISPKFKRVHESFLLAEITFWLGKKIFCDFSVLLNQKKRQREWNKENKNVDTF